MPRKLAEARVEVQLVVRFLKQTLSSFFTLQVFKSTIFFFFPFFSSLVNFQMRVSEFNISHCLIVLFTILCSFQNVDGGEIQGFSIIMKGQRTRRRLMIHGNEMIEPREMKRETGATTGSLKLKLMPRQQGKDLHLERKRSRQTLNKLWTDPRSHFLETGHQTEGNHQGVVSFLGKGIVEVVVVMETIGGEMYSVEDMC